MASIIAFISNASVVLRLWPAQRLVHGIQYCQCVVDVYCLVAKSGELVAIQLVDLLVAALDMTDYFCCNYIHSCTVDVDVGDVGYIHIADGTILVVMVCLIVHNRQLVVIRYQRCNFQVPIWSLLREPIHVYINRDKLLKCFNRKVVKKIHTPIMQKETTATKMKHFIFINATISAFVHSLFIHLVL